MTAKEILNKYRNEYYNAPLANALDKVLPELERLRKFKETFDAYELATRQGYVAYEILQEYKENIYKLIDKSLELRNKENKTEHEKGIARGYYIALNMLGYGDE
jgi:hypothetical protein